MKKLTFEKMEEVNGGEWCAWGNGNFFIYSTLGPAMLMAALFGYSYSYCIT